MAEAQITPAPASHAASRSRRRGWLAILGACTLLAGIPLYALLSDDPLIRSTGWPTFALGAVGALLGLAAAWRDRRRWVNVVAALTCVMLALFAVTFFWLADLPDATPAAQLAVAPDFTLPDQEQRPTVLRDAYAVGPVLLVFYRGHW
jgi:hypothetical protein